MSKRNQLVNVETVSVPESEFISVKVVLLIDSKVLVRGEVSGTEYVFNGAGSVVDIDERDVESLLLKRQGEKQCCGGTDKGNKIFELAQGI